MMIESSSPMASTKTPPKFDPTAYAAKRKEQIAKAKELRESRSKLAPPRPESPQTSTRRHSAPFQSAAQQQSSRSSSRPSPAHRRTLSTPPNKGMDEVHEPIFDENEATWLTGSEESGTALAAIEPSVKEEVESPAIPGNRVSITGPPGSASSPRSTIPDGSSATMTAQTPILPTPPAEGGQKSPQEAKSKKDGLLARSLKKLFKKKRGNVANAGVLPEESDSPSSKVTSPTLSPSSSGPQRMIPADPVRPPPLPVSNSGSDQPAITSSNLKPSTPSPRSKLKSSGQDESSGTPRKVVREREQFFVGPGDRRPPSTVTTRRIPSPMASPGTPTPGRFSPVGTSRSGRKRSPGSSGKLVAHSDSDIGRLQDNAEQQESLQQAGSSPSPFDMLGERKTSTRSGRGDRVHSGRLSILKPGDSLSEKASTASTGQTAARESWEEDLGQGVRASTESVKSSRAAPEIAEPVDGADNLEEENKEGTAKGVKAIPVVVRRGFFGNIKAGVATKGGKSKRPQGKATPEALHGPSTNVQVFSGETPEEGQLNLAKCADCGRNFRVEVLAKHSSVCKKVFLSKRKSFDSTAHRLSDPELAPFVDSARKAVAKSASKQGSKGKVGKSQGGHAGSEREKAPAWKARSEAFQATIRAARELKKAEAMGIDISKLPRPPTIEDPSYIKCPNCGRTFAPVPAERHIPKCKDIKAKPRPLVRKSSTTLARPSREK